MRKDKGAVEYSLSVMLLAICVLIFLFCFRVRSAGIEKAYAEDALVSANLAAAVINTEFYGENEELLISDEEAYERFQQSLKLNLNLDDDFMPQNRVLMEQPVKILEFHVYNRKETEIVHIRYDEFGNRDVQSLNVSDVQTPNGKAVESATIYSKIEIDVKGFLNARHRVTLENSVDVVKNE